MREYIKKPIHIDGRNIPIGVVTAIDYMILTNLVEDDEQVIEDYCENNLEITELISEILALKTSHYLLRRVSYSCGSLSDAIYKMMNEKCIKLNELYKIEFDFDIIYRDNKIDI